MSCRPKPVKLSEEEKRELERLEREIHEENLRVVNAECFTPPPPWYDVSVARGTADPDILRRIVKKGHNDMVSNEAVLNLHCPPDALLAVISRREDKLITAHAVRNANCPVEGLKEYLKMGRADENSVNIVMNRDDCPDNVKVEWFDIMVSSGDWGSGDPEVLEKIREKVDTLR